ncbi:hypothetical protein C8R44DRAFT_736019 [Mycena epipterygia]|nr:hypothetical protein C8R44DRAFT_736019 [Mycena epipterygia]
MVKHLLDTVRKVYLSDPPGISLYYLMGKDRHGLNIYCTIRGTNSLEGGFHMVVRRIFGSLASPELAECLLINWILQQNKRVLPTRIATSETIRILPTAKSLAEEYGITKLPWPYITGICHHHDVPVHVLTRLCTTTTNPYRYLQLWQHVLSAVLPVHTHKEYTTFKTNINHQKFRKSGGKIYPPHENWESIDYVKFTKWWNDQIQINDSTTKFHFNSRCTTRKLFNGVQCSTLASGSNFAACKPLCNILDVEDNHTDVLPTILLADASSDGELDLSISGSTDLRSFNPMAGKHGDSEFTEWEQVDDYSEISFVQFPDHNIPEVPILAPVFPQSTPSVPRAQYQVLLLGAAALVASPLRNQSSGNQSLCMCGHPALKPDNRHFAGFEQELMKICAPELSPYVVQHGLKHTMLEVPRSKSTYSLGDVESEKRQET